MCEYCVNYTDMVRVLDHYCVSWNEYNNYNNDVLLSFLIIICDTLTFYDITYIIIILVDLEKDSKPKLSPKNFSSSIPSLQRSISYGATVESYRQTIADIISQIRFMG